MALAVQIFLIALGVTALGFWAAAACGKWVSTCPNNG